MAAGADISMVTLVGALLAAFVILVIVGYMDSFGQTTDSLEPAKELQQFNQSVYDACTQEGGISSYDHQLSDDYELIIEEETARIQRQGNDQAELIAEVGWVVGECDASFNQRTTLARQGAYTITESGGTLSIELS